MKRSEIEVGSFVVVQRGGWSTVGKRGIVIKIDGDVATVQTPYDEVIIRNYRDLELS